ncbi:hypothetical protein C2845_PM03G24470 [Panicum miliaceum]|uniref:CMP/dCMP-type deaminase domain-containing protein n=1 Tax=Panicum miliaceum TaxID=4540 RepID=A0A3L6T7H3_PANMI|nr:hypothetical protein C2845_PM03G24470 [Panicum miliaceum]
MEAPQGASSAARQDDRDYQFIVKAINEAYQAVDGGGGGPFGAVIVRGDEEVKVVYGAKAEVAAAAGFNGTIPDAFVEYYKKSGIVVRQAEGEAAWIAEEVFEKGKEKFRMK